MSTPTDCCSGWRGKRIHFLVGAALLLFVATLVLNFRPIAILNLPVVEDSPSAEIAPPCPWREPEEDLKAFFPGATDFRAEDRILSGLRIELAHRLGRPATGEENLLRAFRVYRDQTPVGYVLPRRVKGGFGAIELVLAVAEGGHVEGIKLQRLREPDSVSAVLQSPEWLGSFKGSTAASNLRLSQQIPDVPPEARPSAAAIVESVRSLLILLDTSQTAPQQQHVHRAETRAK